MARGKKAAAEAGGEAGVGHNTGMDAAKFEPLYEKVAAAESLMAEARQKAKTAYDDFESAGGDKKALKAAMKFRTRSAHEQKRSVRNTLLYARFMDLPVGTQLTLEQIVAIGEDKTSDDADAEPSVH